MISRSKAALAASTTCLLAAAIGAGAAEAGPFLSPVASLATTAEAVNGDVALVKGTFTDKSGKPIPGPITVVAMPDDMKKWGKYPIVATGVADSTGAFSATITDLATIETLAKEQGGRLVDFTVTSDVYGTEGAAILSRRVQGTPEHPVLVEPDAGQLATRAALATPPPTVAIESSWMKGTGDVATRAGKPKGQCKVTWFQKPPVVTSMNKWTIVGELNNAYNDGTTAKFSFGMGRDANAKIGIAHSIGGGSYEIGAEKTIESGATVEFPEVKRRYARKMQSQFEYTRTRYSRECPDEPTQYRDDIRATSWLTFGRTEVKQPKALDRCYKKLAGFDPGYKFTRDRADAIRWNVGVEAFGVGLTTQMGYSQQIKTEMEFGGKNGKKHRLCGEDPSSSPYTSGRIYSGTVPSQK